VGIVARDSPIKRTLGLDEEVPLVVMMLVQGSERISIVVRAIV
jgi:hypothetical protein